MIPLKQVLAAFPCAQVLTEDETVRCLAWFAWLDHNAALPAHDLQMIPDYRGVAPRVRSGQKGRA